jgi:hypothetical protein
MKPPAGRRLRPEAVTDYTLSKLQDEVSRLHEAVRMIEMDIAALGESLDEAKRNLKMPIGSYNVRGPDEFFED